MIFYIGYEDGVLYVETDMYHDIKKIAVETINNTAISKDFYPIEILAEQTEPNCSEKPNNCEHITEDGVTCAKYPACDDCLDNPLNKVKGSERLVKSSEQTEPQTIRCPKCGRTDYIRDMEKDMGIKGSHYKYKCINCNTYIKTEPTISKMEQVDKDINVRSKDEPQTDIHGLTDCDFCKGKNCEDCEGGKDEPQTERSDK